MCYMLKYSTFRVPFLLLVLILRTVRVQLAFFLPNIKPPKGVRQPNRPPCGMSLKIVNNIVTRKAEGSICVNS